MGCGCSGVQRIDRESGKKLPSAPNRASGPSPNPACLHRTAPHPGVPGPHMAPEMRGASGRARCLRNQEQRSTQGVPLCAGYSIRPSLRQPVNLSEGKAQQREASHSGSCREGCRALGRIAPFLIFKLKTVAADVPGHRALHVLTQTYPRGFGPRVQIPNHHIPGLHQHGRGQ